MLRDVALSFFSQSNEFFKTAELGLIEVNSLCGTRTFNSLCQEHPDLITRVDNTGLLEPNLTVVRDEKVRLVSAYNKKVLGVHSDFRKHLLLYSMGIKPDSSFEAFIRALLARRAADKEIDKHFKPCSGKGERVDIDTLIISHPDSSLCNILKYKRVASGVSLAGGKHLNYRTLDRAQREIMGDYLGNF